MQKTRTISSAGKIDFSKLAAVEKGQKRILGTGGYASVSLVKDQESGKLYALKEVHLIYLR